MAREPWFARAEGLFKAAPLALLALLFGAPASSQSSSASGWDLCNQTSFVLEAATGRPDNQQTIIVEGWTRIRPGECRAALDGPVRPGVYFVFARSSKAHRGGQREWKGATTLCVDPNGSFSVPNQSSCSSLGLEERDFQAVRIDKTSGSKMTFHETERYNKTGAGQSATNAGIQRLLDDAGVAADVVDGYLGRESRAAISTFLVERQLPAALANSASELIDILEDVARNRSLEVGLMLCNRTDHGIRAAIARRRPDGWESRGWWELAAQTCVRTIDESLIAAPHYVFGEIETQQGVRPLNGAETIFCTARSKFAILGREDCTKRRFRQASFLETAIPEDGKLVYEFFERNFGPPQKKQP
jgi:uncharacterized membrane protein